MYFLHIIYILHKRKQEHNKERHKVINRLNDSSRVQKMSEVKK